MYSLSKVLSMSLFARLATGSTVKPFDIATHQLIAVKGFIIHVDWALRA